MTRKLILSAAALVALFAAGQAQAAARIYQGANLWYTVQRGAVVYSVFYPDGPEGVCTYGAEGAPEPIYVKLKTTAPSALKRMGVMLQPGDRCGEEPAQNGAGAAGWAYTCVFPITRPDAPVAPSVVATATPPPAQTSTVKPAPATAPTPAATPQAPRATAVATAATPVQTAPATASTVADQQLNGAVKAQLDAIDARNAKRKSDYEAAQKATEAAFAAQMAGYKQQLEDLERRRQADLAAWEAQVAACKAGDHSQCATKP